MRKITIILFWTLIIAMGGIAATDNVVKSPWTTTTNPITARDGLQVWSSNQVASAIAAGGGTATFNANQFSAGELGTNLANGVRSTNANFYGSNDAPAKFHGGLDYTNDAGSTGVGMIVTNGTVTLYTNGARTITLNAASGLVSGSNFSGSGTLLSGVILDNGGSGINTHLTTPSITNGVTVEPSSVSSITVTSIPNAYGNLLMISIPVGRISGSLSNSGVMISFDQNTPGDQVFGVMMVNPHHDSGPLDAANPWKTEFQFTTPHHMAIAPGYQNPPGHLQWGAGQSSSTNGNWWSGTRNAGTWPYGLTAIGPTNFGYSVPWLHIANGWASGVEQARYCGPYATWASAMGVSGLWEFGIASEIGIYTGGNTFSDNWNLGTVQRASRHLMGDHTAFVNNGAYVGIFTNQTPATNTLALDAADFGWRNYTILTSTLTLSTTNTIKSFTNQFGQSVLGTNSVLRPVYYLRATVVPVTLTYPTNWNTNGIPLPSTIPVGKYLRLELEDVGLGGETNQTPIYAAIHHDYTQPAFAWDTEASNFLVRAAIPISTTNLEALAVNRLATQAKAHSWWTMEDCIYPMVGTNFSAHCYNLKTNSFHIVTNAAWVTGCTHDVNGVTGNGSSGYGDTGFIPGTHGGGTAAFQLNSSAVFWYGGTTLPSATDPEWFIGCVGSATRSGGFKNGANQFFSAGWNANVGFAGSAAANVPSSNWNGPFAAGVTNSTTLFNGMRSTYATQTLTTSPTALPAAASMYILAANNGGAASFNNSNLRGAMIGAGINSTMWAVIYADWQEFETILGREAH